ncbi:flagellar hook-associated protein FlgK [Sodalis sp. RH16]|uniref:flagellar hook-associated protein FlgK n=1 Tax=unclassified Sodalis (in: enterobacteria) TaxID=2636512 RepID=UPI0039B4949B
MSSSLTNIAASGIQAAQIALNTVGNNISNEPVAGYNEEKTQLSESLGSGLSGNGVTVTGVTRVYDSLVVSQLQTASATADATTTYYNQVSQIDDMLSTSDTDLSSAMSTFFTSIQSMSSNASDTSARQTVIGSAGSMVDQFQSAATYLQSMGTSVNQQVSTSAAEINNYTKEIASLNSEIVSSGGSQAPNSLLDQRDELVSELNGIVGVTSSVQDNGSVNLTFANGMTLVQGSSAYQVQAVPSSADASKTVLAYDRGTGTPVQINDASITTGSLGGLLSFRDGALTDATNALGQLALSLASNMNQTNEAGVDLNGDAGSAFFTYADPTVTANSKNSGTAQASATYDGDNTDQVQASQYQVKYVNGNWQVTQSSTGTVLAAADVQQVTDSTTGVTTLTFDGLNVAVTGTPANNDSFTVDPVSNVIGSMKVAITDPGDIAAGLPDDDDDGTETGASDNRNAENMLALQNDQIVGGSATLSTAYATLVSNVGTETSNAEVTSTAQANIVTALTNQQQSSSGVNLDDEYIDLTRYQQYYQANAQVISTASDLFNSLLSAVAG